MEIGLRRLIDSELAAHVEESRRFYAAPAAGERRRPDPATPRGLREARERQAASPAGTARLRVRRVAGSGGREVPVRIVEPEQGEIRGACLDIHSGGFHLGPSAREDARNTRLADALGVAVVSVDYRLAPEHPWPSAPDDCETAALWLLDRARGLFGTERLVIGGVWAGATLALTTLLRLRDRGLDRFAGAVLQYGAYDLSGRSPGGRLYAGEFFIRDCAGSVADRTDPDISPLYGDLRELPPALVVVGTADILLEDGLALAARLSAAGGEVDLRVYPESPHGFTLGPTAMAAAACGHIDSRIAERIAGSPA